jgi:hypothetical protein
VRGGKQFQNGGGQIWKGGKADGSGKEVNICGKGVDRSEQEG